MKIKQLTSSLLLSGALAFNANAGDVKPLKSNELGITDFGPDHIPELDCIVEPGEVIDVGSTVRGVVESVLTERSDLVKKGEIIVEIESSVEQATVDLAKMRATLNTAIKLRKETAAFGHLSMSRNETLVKTSAISRQEMDQLETQTRIAELQVIQERDNKDIAKLEHARALAVLEKRKIRSPVDGVVMERFKSRGEYVEDEPLMRIAQLDPLSVEVIVPVNYLGYVVPGMQAEVTSNLIGSETHLATVERVDRVADAASGTYAISLNLPNPDYKIPAGLRCRVAFLQTSDDEREEIASNSESVMQVIPGQDG